MIIEYADQSVVYIMVGKKLSQMTTKRFCTHATVLVSNADVTFDLLPSFFFFGSISGEMQERNEPHMYSDDGKPHT